MRLTGALLRHKPEGLVGGLADAQWAVEI